MKQRSDGRWVKSVTIKGKAKYFYSSEKTERQATKDINQQIIEYKESETIGPLFSDVAELWKLSHFPTLENNSLKAYRPALSDVLKAFGDKRIKSIEPSDAERFIGELANAELAQKTVKARLLVLNLIFKFAYIKGYVASNPCQYVSVPKNLSKTKREALSNEEIEAVKANCDKSQCAKLALFLLLTGCRRGEALALTYKDIDFENKTVQINKTIEWLGNVPHIKNHPKTDAGIRTIPLPSLLFEKVISDSSHKPNELIFPNKDGKIITNASVTRMWNTYRKQTGLNITPHQLRHAYASILYDAGIDVKTAQTFLGHANIQTTMDIYTHLSESRKTKAGDIINKYIISFDKPTQELVCKKCENNISELFCTFDSNVKFRKNILFCPFCGTKL